MLKKVCCFTFTIHCSRLTTHSAHTETSSADSLCFCSQPTAGSPSLRTVTHWTVGRHGRPKHQERRKPGAIALDCTANVCTCCPRLVSRLNTRSRRSQIIKATHCLTAMQYRRAVPGQLAAQVQTTQPFHRVGSTLYSPSPSEISSLRLLVARHGNQTRQKFQVA